MNRDVREVAASIYSAVAVAYGYEEPLSDDESRARNPEEWCECAHHYSTHRGLRGDGPCADCRCSGFRSAAT